MANCKVLNRKSFYSPQNVSKQRLNDSVFNFQYSEINSKSQAQLNKNYGFSNLVNNFLQTEIISQYFPKNNIQNNTKSDKSKCILIKNDKRHQNEYPQNSINLKDQHNESLSKYQKCFNLFKQQYSNHIQRSRVEKFGNQINLDKEINKNRQKEQQIEDSEEEDEEEFSIWDEKNMKDSGVDTDLFIDARGKKLEFYQIYRLRSSFYQPQYVSRLDTIKAVQAISCHYNQEISINKMKQQQDYLDQYFDVQKKKNINAINSASKNQKCQTERTKRTQTQHSQQIKVIEIYQQKDQEISKLNMCQLPNQLSQQSQYSKKHQDYKKDSPLQRKFESVNQKNKQINKIINYNQQCESRQKICNYQKQYIDQIDSQKTPIKQISQLHNSSQVDVGMQSCSK
ncbi:hypothetical protein ABPG73_000605 [Tetrahymena malaccensis]